MAADAIAVAPASKSARPGAARFRWLAATVALTVTPILVLPWWAPPGSQQPAAGLGWLLVAGSSGHVAATGWFYSVREVRTHMRDHWIRFVLAPVALAGAGAVLAVTLPARTMASVLLALFGWQFVHFQKQNLGVAALAARSHGVAALSRGERAALLLAASGAVGALVGHPGLAQVVAPHVSGLFLLGEVAFGIAVVTGVVLLVRRPRSERPVPYVLAYATSLLFFTPVWLFGSPYAAVAGLTVAHGLQYLLLVGMVAAGGPRGRQNRLSVIVLIDIAVLGGLLLNHVSHLHAAGPVGRCLYGIYLGLTAAHFVADAGLWRLRDRFPRAFLTERLPFLLSPISR